MNANPLRISNRDARRLWLHAQGLAETPTGRLDVLGIIERLGFVQLDTIQIVARAHHHILWSRNQHYREPMLDKLLGKERSVFEHFTHDASVLPMTSYPLWQRQFKRMKAKIRRSSWWNSIPNSDSLAAIKERIAREGPLSTHAFDTKCVRKKVVWQRPPHKQALDFMWYVGELATSHRQNFTKFYDLCERVIPEDIRGDLRSDADQVDWLCKAALDRLAFASEGELQRFWEACDRREIKTWCDADCESVDVAVETIDGSVISARSPADIEERLSTLPTPTSRLRIINPFDPVARDRTRLKRLFGFDYRIEIFVPAAQRRWGYYVFPLLEGDRFVGRLEARADRREGRLDVLKLWSEPGVRWTAARDEKLQAELVRLARLVGAPEIVRTSDAIRPS